MASKVKVTVTLDETLVNELEKISRQTPTHRSRLVEESLRFWRRSQLERQLKEGYQFMSAEDRATSESHLAAGWEVLS